MGRTSQRQRQSRQTQASRPAKKVSRPSSPPAFEHFRRTGLGPQDIESLQRAAGNKAVQRLLAPPAVTAGPKAPATIRRDPTTRRQPPPPPPRPRAKKPAPAIPTKKPVPEAVKTAPVTAPSSQAGTSQTPRFVRTSPPRRTATGQRRHRKRRGTPASRGSVQPRPGRTRRGPPPRGATVSGAKARGTPIPSTAPRATPVTPEVTAARTTAKASVNKMATDFTAWASQEPQKAYFANHPESAKHITEVWKNHAQQKIEACTDVASVAREQTHQEKTYQQLFDLKRLEPQFKPLRRAGAGGLTDSNLEQGLELAHEGLIDNPIELAGFGNEIFQAIAELGKKPEESTELQKAMEKPFADLGAKFLKAIGKEKVEDAPAIKGWGSAESLSDQVGGGFELADALGSGLKGIVDFAVGVRQWKQKKSWKAVEKFIDGFSGLGASFAKGASGALSFVSSVTTSDAAKGVIDVFKEALGGIPAALQTIVQVVRAVAAVVKGKTGDFFEAGWQALKSGFEAAVGVAKTFGAVFGKIPLVGSIASAVSAFVSLGESLWMFAKRGIEAVKMDRVVSKIKERQKKRDSVRIRYLLSINKKRFKNIMRGIVRYAIAVHGTLTKVIGTLGNLGSDIVALAGVTAPGAAIGKAVSTVVEVLGSATGFVGKMIEFVPKAGHGLRQLGRNIFGSKKSSKKKRIERAAIVREILEDAATLPSEYDPSKPEDLTALRERYEDLKFDIEATGVDTKEFYGYNELPATKRGPKQAKALWKALKER